MKYIKDTTVNIVLPLDEIDKKWINILNKRLIEYGTFIENKKIVIAFIKLKEVIKDFYNIIVAIQREDNNNKIEVLYKGNYLYEASEVFLETIRKYIWE